MKNFDFDNDKSKNIFQHPYSYYVTSERLQGEEQFHSKNYLLEMPRFHAKVTSKMRTLKQPIYFLKTVEFCPTFNNQIDITLAIFWEKLQNYTF